MAQSGITADDGRILVSQFLITSLGWLAVGTGAVPDRTAHGLTAEIGRRKFLQRFYVAVDDVNGTLGPFGAHRYAESATPTNFIYFRWRFETDEAVGTWTEAAIYGGEVAYTTLLALLLDGSQAGDDRANADVVLGGGYAGDENQTLTVTVTTGGGSGVAHIAWASTGSEPAGNATVTFGTPVALGATGLTLTFDGGSDGVLTLGDAWKVRCTVPPVNGDFAANGLYDPIANEDGQVASNGLALRFLGFSPGIQKVSATLDVEHVVEVVNNG